MKRGESRKANAPHTLSRCMVSNGIENDKAAIEEGPKLDLWGLLHGTDQDPESQMAKYSISTLEIALAQALKDLQNNNESGRSY